MEENYYLRRAKLADREMIFMWSNETECRKNSLNTSYITFDEHVKWFENKMQSKDCFLYIFYFKNTPLGQIRVDIKKDVGIISFSIDYHYRGQGLGKKILELIEEVPEVKNRVNILQGIVKYGNLASMRSFHSLYYDVLEKEDYMEFSKNLNKSIVMENNNQVKYNIPYGTQCIEEDDIQAVVEVLKSDYLTTGPKVKEFEQKVADYVGAKYAVAVSNGTAALHAACYAAGISENDEVITTPMTFAATANSVLYCGGTPVFADIKADTYNIDPKEIQKKITNKTKAIIPVHFTGQPCEMDEINRIAKENNLIVIEDAAHALGANYRNKKVGNISDMTIFSFHPVKHITTGEGGMITTNQKNLYEKLLLFRSHGITRNKDMMSKYEGEWYYQQLDLGFNYRMTDIQSALGCSQMKKLEKFIERRKEVAKRYVDAFQNYPEIKLPYQMDGCENSWHLFIIQVENRKKVFDKLRSVGIYVNVNYIPVYHHPYYQMNGYDKVCCKNAEELYEKCISLPMYPKLTFEEQDYVIEQVIKAVREC